MQKLLLASSLLVLTACSKPIISAGMAPAAGPLVPSDEKAPKVLIPTEATKAAFSPLGPIGLTAPHKLGETVALQDIAGAGKLTFKNVATGASKTVNVDAATASLRLDASTLPDLRQDAKLQEFSLDVELADRSSHGLPLFMVSDADVQPFPMYFYQLGGPQPASSTAPGPIATPGPGAWASKDSTAGPEGFIQKFVADWKLQAPAITHAPVERAAVALPKYLETAPATTKFVRYEVQSQFPLYLVPKENSTSGKVDVYAPASIAIVLTQTDPADLVSLVAK